MDNSEDSGSIANNNTMQFCGVEEGKPKVTDDCHDEMIKDKNDIVDCQPNVAPEGFIWTEKAIQSISIHLEKLDIKGFDKHLELYILQTNLSQDLGIRVPLECILQYLESKWHKDFNEQEERKNILRKIIKLKMESMKKKEDIKKLKESVREIINTNVLVDMSDYRMDEL